MNPDPNRLQHKQQQNLPAAVAEQTHFAAQSQKEFATPEDLLRHDCEANPVPPELAHRLNQSLAAEPKPAQSWIKRLFG